MTTKKELSEKIDKLENLLKEWIEYDAIRHAELSALVANAPHIQRKDKKLWKKEDFLPKKEISAEELENLWWKESTE